MRLFSSRHAGDPAPFTWSSFSGTGFSHSGVTCFARSRLAALTSFVLLSTAAPNAVTAHDELVALGQARTAGSQIVDTRSGAALSLALSQAVPYRIFTLTDPARMVIDFSEVDWTGFNPIAFDQAEAITSVRVGGFRPGWSRMVLDLAEPLAVQTAELRSNDAGAHLILALKDVTGDVFIAGSGAPEAAKFAQAVEPATLNVAPRAPIGTAPLRVVLDPGHGGIDPGAERDGHRESDLMLMFAQELRDVLVRAGNFEVILTRDDDSFVPLEARVAIAQAVSADVFISLHADALAEGSAQGATVYTLADRASDDASRKLAERHDRDDLLAGVDLSDQDDVIVNVLLDMARTETQPRTMRLANTLVGRFQSSIGTHKRPHLQAGFSVLKSADVPSVLVELGFLSSPSDREKLLDPQWRATAAQAIRASLDAWVDEERKVAAQARQ